MDGFQHRVRIRVPVTPSRLLGGIVRFAVAYAFAWLLVRAAVGMLAEGPSPLEAAEWVARAALSPALWFALIAVASAARCFLCTQTVWFEGQSMFIKTAGPLPPSWVRQHSFDAYSLKLVTHATPWGRRFPELRLPMGARIRMKPQPFTRLGLIPAFSLAEAQELAGLLNAVAAGEKPGVRPGSPWEIVTLTSAQASAGGDAGRAWSDDPTSHLRDAWTYMAGLLAGAAVGVPVLVVCLVAGDPDTSLGSLVWLPLAFAVPAFFVARVSRDYYREHPADWRSLLAGITITATAVVSASATDADFGLALADACFIAAPLVGCAALVVGFILAQRSGA